MAEMQVSPQEEMANTQEMKVIAIERPGLPVSMNPCQREGLRVLKNMIYDRTYSISSLTLGETQSGVNRHLETKLLVTSSRKD